MASKYVQKFASTADFLARAADRSLAFGIGAVSGLLYGNVSGSAVALVDVSTAQTLTNKTLTAPIFTNPAVSGVAPATITGSSATLGTTHRGRVTTLNRAAGIALTLPAATGSGDWYELVILATFTGAASVAVANAQDYMIGLAQMGIDGGTFVPHQYPTANTGTVATESDTISLFGTALSQGGVKGATVFMQDIAANIWQVLYQSDAGGTEATPFSAAV